MSTALFAGAPYAFAGLSISGAPVTGSGNNLTLTYGSSVSAGTVLVAFAQGYGCASFAPTDNQGAYTLISSPDNGSYGCWFWRTATASYTPVFAFNNGTYTIDGELTAVTGFTGTPTIDTAATNQTFTSSTSPITIGPITPVRANEIIFAGAVTTQNTIGSPSAGWTTINDCDTSASCSWYDITGSTATMTQSQYASGYWFAGVFAIYDNSSGGAGLSISGTPAVVGSSSNVTVTYGSSVASGTVLVAFAQGWACQNYVPSDAQGNYALIAATTNNACFYWRIANAPFTPTVAINNGSNYVGGASLTAVTGFVGTPTVDATNSGTNFTASTSPLTVGPLTPAGSNEILFAGASTTQNTIGSPSAGWTTINDCGTSASCSWYNITGSATTMTQALYAPGTWWAVSAGIYDSGTSSGPSTPSGLSATDIDSTHINLAWSASTGGSGSIAYNVQRCTGVGCSSFTLIGSSLSAAYNDTGLSAATSYSYRVQAVDALGHLSGWSNTASVTTSGSGASGPCAASATNTFTYTYNSGGQLQSISTTAGCTAQYTYDANGNLINVQVTQ